MLRQQRRAGQVSCDPSGQPDPGWNIRRPRTAVGYVPADSPPKLRILTVDGDGVTIGELRALMTQVFGVTNAMALDGGGSTQFWAKTSPSETYRWGGSGSTRPVVSALVVYAGPVKRTPPPVIHRTEHCSWKRVTCCGGRVESAFCSCNGVKVDDSRCSGIPAQCEYILTIPRCRNRP